MSKKFTKAELAEFEKARVKIEQVVSVYANPKKAKENDKKIMAAYNASQANVKAKQENPEAFRKKQSEAFKKAWADPEVKENFMLGIAKRDSNPVYKEKVALARKKEAISEEGRKRRSEHMLTYSQSDRGKAELAERNSKPRAHAKPLITPYGLFRNVNTTVQYFLENKLTTRKNKMSVAHLIRANINDDPANYFYITIEDYELCLEDSVVIDKLRGKPERKRLAKEAKARIRMQAAQTTAIRQATGKLNGRPIKTNLGVFASKREAFKFHNITSRQLSVLMEIYPEQCCYISKEEYIMLTGKE